MSATWRLQSPTNKARALSLLNAWGRAKRGPSGSAAVSSVGQSTARALRGADCFPTRRGLPPSGAATAPRGGPTGLWYRVRSSASASRRSAALQRMPLHGGLLGGAAVPAVRKLPCRAFFNFVTCLAARDLSIRARFARCSVRPRGQLNLQKPTYTYSQAACARAGVGAAARRRLLTPAWWAARYAGGRPACNVEARRIVSVRRGGHLGWCSRVARLGAGRQAVRWRPPGPTQASVVVRWACIRNSENANYRGEQGGKQAEWGHTDRAWTAPHARPRRCAVAFRGANGGQKRDGAKGRAGKNTW